MYPFFQKYFIQGLTIGCCERIEGKGRDHEKVYIDFNEYVDGFCNAANVCYCGGVIADIFLKCKFQYGGGRWHMGRRRLEGGILHPDWWSYVKMTDVHQSGTEYTDNMWDWSGEAIKVNGENIITTTLLIPKPESGLLLLHIKVRLL